MCKCYAGDREHSNKFPVHFFYFFFSPIFENFIKKVLTLIFQFSVLACKQLH